MYAPQPILEALIVQPFRPFRLELSNGEMINVTHPEQVWVFATEILVAKPGTNGDRRLYGGFSIIGLDHVVQVHRQQEIGP
ncbi:MAG: hypothetical protein L0228_20115 [Planctomycetes bacterium]|nr:hypothetical protein [Planctomycetota bacterium]